MKKLRSELEERLNVKINEEISKIIEDLERKIAQMYQESILREGVSNIDEKLDSLIEKIVFKLLKAIENAPSSKDLEDIKIQLNHLFKDWREEKKDIRKFSVFSSILTPLDSVFYKKLKEKGYLDSFKALYSHSFSASTKEQENYLQNAPLEDLIEPNINEGKKESNIPKEYTQSYSNSELLRRTRIKNKQTLLNLQERWKYIFTGLIPLNQRFSDKVKILRLTEDINPSTQYLKEFEEMHSSSFKHNSTFHEYL